MDDRQDSLQERLARFENGEPLEACLSGLGQDEADLLRTAAQLRSTPFPSRPAAVVAAQRGRVLEAARTMKVRSVMPSNTSSRTTLIFTLSGAAALLLAVCVLAGLAIGGIVWWRGAGAQAGLVAPNPQTAVLANLRGNVQVQIDGVWERARAGQAVVAGQGVRTGSLSSATLVFFDQSRALLGPSTEVSVDALDARRTGSRIIRLTQMTGESNHVVAHSRDSASVYEVRTPAGSGVAKGTEFRVRVTSSVLVRFEVDEGEVAVTHLNVTVIVMAGQSTIIPGDGPPTEPFFRITGEGEVLQTGAVWNIAGQLFAMDANTIVVGGPDVGDWVAVSGRLLPDGTRVADQIVLLRQAMENRFTFAGRVDAIGSEVWTIGGRQVFVDELTAIEDGVEVGDTVQVSGGIAQDGALWASEIQLESEEGLPFEFVGVVDEIGDTAWTISGVAIATDEDTEIEDGIEPGDVVQVEGQKLDDGIRLAQSIQLAEEDERKFEISGPVESKDPWKVAGIEFETGSGTEIDEGIDTGDLVKVEGRILEDGRWLAAEIELLEEETSSRFELVGKVTGIDPWIVGGVTLATDENTEIDEEVEVGDFARARGTILADGTWLADEIQRLDESQGCVDITTVVSAVSDGQIVLLDGQTINLDISIEITGDIQPGAVIRVRICVSEDGQTVIVSITVIFQLGELPTATPTPGLTPTAAGGEGGKVTVCHIPPGNPDNAHTITIGRSALDAHLAHGDTMGPCP